MKKIILIIMLLVFVQVTKAQDTCATAVPVTAGFYVVSAINGSQVPTPICTQFGAVPATRPPAGEWYIYTPTENHSVTVTTDLTANAPLVDTRFHVYKGTCDNLICYSGDDDNGTGNSSTATFDVISGTSYYIAFDNRWTSAGFTWRLSETAFVPTPCATATAITAGTTTVAAIDEENTVSPCSNATLAKWYVYSPNQNYVVTISSDLAQNICKDTNFNVYSGTCSGTSLLNCLIGDDDSGVIACDSGNPDDSLLSKKSFSVTAGGTYYIVWDNKHSADGFDFTLTETPIVIPVNYTSQVISTINSNYNNCVVDMNGDGIDDIVGVSSGNLKVHYQQPGGTFSISSFSVSGTGTTLPSWSIAAGDYNRDGYNDLLFGAGGGPSFWESNSTGTAYISKTTGTSYLCQRTNFIDVNNDGNLDAFVCDDNNPNRYYLNDGAGNWTHYQSGVGAAYHLGLTVTGGNYASIWTDYDNDGDRDMFISKCSGPPCELHRNDGAAGYTDISAIAGINRQPVQSWSSAVADFDNDGDMDIMVGSNGGVKNILFRNNLDTTNNTEEAFTDVTAGSGLNLDTLTNRDYVAYDFDNDGLVDILGSGSRIFFNQGNMIFAPTTYAAMAIGPIGDLNDDGFLDIQNENTIRYAVPNGNNWFKVRLQGTQSNSNGIGARIEIYGTFGKQIRDVRSGEGFEYMSSLNAHFGLGEATAIETLVVRWPSGIVDTIENPTINEAFRVTEGSTLGVNANLYSAFNITPNPTKEFLNINVKANSTESFKAAQIFDLTGRIVLDAPLTSMKLNIGSLQSGTYLLVLQNQNGKSFTQKFIKE